MNLLDDYLVRGHQQDLLRAACTRRLEHRFRTRHRRRRPFRRSS